MIILMPLLKFKKYSNLEPLLADFYSDVLKSIIIGYKSNSLKKEIMLKQLTQSVVFLI